MDAKTRYDHKDSGCCTEITSKFAVDSAWNATSFSQVVTECLLKPTTPMH